MSAYSDFAKIYDALTFDVDYDAWCGYIEKAFEKLSKKPELVCELGCGTGSIACLLAKRGYSMIGIDLSPEMLDIANTKAREAGLDVLFLNQDMADFELYGTVDAFICTLDGVNYLTEDGDFEQMLKLCNMYLNPEGMLIFDINTEHKIRDVIAPETYVYETDEVFYTWQSRLSGELCDYFLTFFVKNGEVYRRFDEVHTERIYTDEYICSCLFKHGFKLISKTDDLTSDNPTENTLRIIYTAVKM